jgi:hypothetical protein
MANDEHDVKAAKSEDKAKPEDNAKDQPYDITHEEVRSTLKEPKVKRPEDDYPQAVLSEPPGF